MIERISAIGCLIAVVACAPASDGGSAPASTADLRALLDSAIQASGADVVGLYYRSLAEGGDSVALNADVRMHAASTMKVPVMQRLFLDHQEGM
ncbi:MAG: serine hydrolase, partial [Longimicrobiales bacterium]|nr:serine hydrolase [Longimicrobiales bacterium]